VRETCGKASLSRRRTPRLRCVACQGGLDRRENADLREEVTCARPASLLDGSLPSSFRVVLR